MPEEPFKYKILIHGDWMDSASGETFTRESPAHGRTVGIYPRCGKVVRGVNRAASETTNLQN